MVVVAIIGILASVALPAYQNFIARAKLAEVFSLINGVKTSVWEDYFGKATMPLATDQVITDILATLETSNYNQKSTYKKVDDNNSEIEIIVDNINSSVNDETIIIGLTALSGTIQVDCSGGSLPLIYRPSRCR